MNGVAGAPLQTKNGDHMAVHETAEELQEILGELLKAAQEEHPLWSLREDKPIIFTHDNPTSSTGAVCPTRERARCGVWSSCLRNHLIAIK